MKFMQIHPFYSSYLDSFYASRPSLHLAPYSEQIDTIVADGFGAAHIFAAYMGKQGYETFFVITNCIQTQSRWLFENAGNFANITNWQQEILSRQIHAFRPDVLYIGDPISHDSKFVRSLEYKPALVIGWRAASIPDGTDFSAFDIIVSSSQTCREKALRHGARAVEHLLPGMPKEIVSAVGDYPEEVDFVFCGSWTPEHHNRNRYLEKIAKSKLFSQENLSLAYYLAGDPLLMPPPVANVNRGPLWGIEMYRALKSGRINFNSSIDLAGKELTNMRMFEISAVGAFQLVEYHPTLDHYFVPGTELETFRTIDELVEKTEYYLTYPIQRRRIADQGQLRCMRDHSMEQRTSDFDAIIKHYLEKKVLTGQFRNNNIDPYDTAYNWGWNNPELRQLVYLCYKTPDLIDNARRFYMSDGFKETVSLLIDMGKAPRKDICVLDFGCGNGVAAYALARVGYSVTGIDSSIGELAGIRAAQKIQGLDGANFEVKQTRSDRLEFPNESFEIVWMREVLHHIDDLLTFLHEVKRVLKPGGILCCLRDAVIWSETQRENFFKKHPFYHITKDEGCYYLHEYREAFEAAGLIIEKEINPVESVINTYPAKPVSGAVYNQAASMEREVGYDLFSFFLRKPIDYNSAVKNTDCAMERFLGIQKQKEAFLKTMAISIPTSVTSTSLAHPSQQLDSSDLVGSFPGVSFGAMVQVLGVRNISIGEGSCIGDCSWLNVCLRDEHLRMRIGNCVLVGRQGVLSTGGSLEIGDYCVLAPRVYISDADHIYTDIMVPILEQGVTLNRSVVVEENCWLGINTVISGHLTIGRGSVIGANAVVTQDIPPFSVAVGNPAQVVKMYSPQSGAWERTRTEKDFRRIQEERQALGIPSRTEYRLILSQRSGTFRLNPILAGRGNI